MAIYGTPLTMGGGGGGQNETLPPLLDNFKAKRLEGGLVPPVSNAVAFKDIPDGSKIKLVKGSNISGTVTYGRPADLNHRIVFDSNDWTRKQFQLENDRGHSNISVSDIDQWLNSTKASNWWGKATSTYAPEPEVGSFTNTTPPDYANEQGFLYQLGITDELLAQNFNDININETAKAKVGLPWVSIYGEEIPYTFFENISMSDFGRYGFLHGVSGELVGKYDKSQAYTPKAPDLTTIHSFTGYIHPMMEPKPETPVALDSDGSYFMFEKQTSIILSADKMPVSRANALAGAVWVYGEHEPKNVNDGTKIELTRDEVITNQTTLPPIALSEISSSSAAAESIINIKESDGKLHPYIYLCKDYPTQNGSLLLRKDCVETQAASKVLWSNSTLRTWCNDTFFNKMVVKDYVLDTTVMGESSSTSKDKVFLLSLTEMGFTEPSGGVALGKKIDYFSSDARRIAFYNGVGSDYWTRSTIGLQPYYITSVGRMATISTPQNVLKGLRPAFVLPLSFKLKPTPNKDGSYDMYEESSAQTLATGKTIADLPSKTKVKLGQYAGQKSPPLERTVVWDKSKNFYARQFTYNNKKQYQTMLEGATAYLPIMPDGQELSKLPSKSKVKLGKFNGNPLKWLVCRDSADQSLRLILDGESVGVIGNKIFDDSEPNNSDINRRSYGNNRYIWSNIRQWLNSSNPANSWYSSQHSADAPPDYTNVAGFLYEWTNEEVNVLENTSWVVTRHRVDGGGTESFQNRIVLPSTTEMGLESNTGGARIDIFNNDGDRAVVGKMYWCRTPNLSSSNYVNCVSSSGTLTIPSAVNPNCKVRPLCKPLSNTLVSIEADIEGCFTLV